ncbi:hypothetical protein F4813DRAFT_249061 [Daldinia decipiens]|uniref:uncharacterized protein n=1 Tax=Daldinia decipiens TaxID=326647 RepID=UPI0020C2C072|nr:uncharacterized protein F4813DRAFT_249061 [Daldinia decipiens]KAI1653594.1 hypothetical protein F4813DRAFT_249061 [Daldinia decipiens]
MGHSYTHIMKRLAIATLVTSSALSFTHASSPPSESPPAETELICHTGNPAECYPKVFSATEDFQPVHDDQDLPPGLHVQLDIQTGQKQAKLYNPAEENPALEGLPVDRSVLIVDPETPQDDQPQIPPGAPAYEPVGLVKAPKEKNEGFALALETVKKSSAANSNAVAPDDLDKALEDLEDLSHGMYYGLQIASDADALHSLFCLLTARDAAQAQRPLSQRTDFLASAILASSLRNNQPALRAVEQSWDFLLEKQCLSSASPDSLQAHLFSALQPTATAGSAEEPAEAYAARLSLAVLDGLLKSPPIAAQFLAHGGMRHFLQILQRTNPVWDARKAKVARIVSDVFLDEEVGAVLSVWPTSASVAEAGVCGAGGPDSLEEGCWEHHLEVISQGSEAPGWSQPLLDLLRRRRAEKPAAQRHGRDEL